MNRHAFGAIFTNEVRVLRKNTVVPVILVAMPLIVISMLRLTMGVALRASGVANANGSELVVPGQALMFGFFLVTFVGNSFFREHGWFTWDRLRTSTATRVDILVGKTLPWLMMSVIQVVLIMVLGMVFFDLPIPTASGMVAVLLTAVAWAVFIGGFSLALCGLVDSMPAVSAVANLGAIFFAAIGGALVPLDQLPGWARAISPAAPTYWCMQSFSTVFIDDQGLPQALGAISVVAAFGIALGAGAWFWFDFDTPKRSWV